MSLRRVVRVAIALVADRSPVVRHQLCGQGLGRLCGLGRQAPGHPFYVRLNSILDEAGFDRFVEEQCRPFYER